LVKLAANYALRARRPAQILSIDMYRVGAAEQLRSYAAILGIGFQALDTPRSLAQALEEHRHKDLVLIDTPGHSEKDIDVGHDLADFFRKHPEIDVHLTLTASMKSADLKHAVDRFNRFQPRKLLFTKLDETASPGTMLSEAVRTGKPISFLTDGQQIPEDIREADKDFLLDKIFGSEADRNSYPEETEDSPSVPDPLWEQYAAGRAVAA